MTLPIATEEHSTPYRFPFLVGVYVATNAIPDAYTVVDGPECIMRKGEWVHGKHDWFSNLLSVFGNHRIASSLVNAHVVTKSRGESVVRQIQKFDQQPDAGVVFVSSMPHVNIIGTQYDTLLRELQTKVEPQLIEVPSRSLEGDWLTGYSDTLMHIARHIDVSEGTPDPEKVAIIGHLMDRTEEDGTANVRELDRMVRAIGLDPVSIWLCGRPYRDLAEVRNAGTLVALPMGVAAAKALAERTGATVLECETPFGLGRTQRLLRTLARATGRAEGAEAFIDRELRRLIPRLEWVVPHVLQGRKLVFDAPPDLFGGFLETARDLGCTAQLLCSSASGAFAPDGLAEEFGTLPPILFEPKTTALKRQLGEIFDAGTDLVIGPANMRVAHPSIVPMLEFGFPSFYSHALFDRPHLGFNGWICFVDRLANKLNDRTYELPP